MGSVSDTEGKKSFVEKIKPGITKIPGDMKFSQPRVWLATWFGSGLLRPAPGTWGSLAAIPFGYAIVYYSGTLSLCIATVLCLIVGTIIANRYQDGGGDHDAKEIVIDEVAGMWLAALPAGTDWRFWVIAFLLFRLFDIKKPWPASYYDNKESGGWNVMMDDIVAGFYAFLGVVTMVMIEMSRITPPGSIQ